MNTHIKILLIEDNPGDVRMIREMLSDIHGGRFHTESSEKLSLGLKRLSEVTFEALLLDLGLPDSDGIETLANADELMYQQKKTKYTDAPHKAD